MFALLYFFDESGLVALILPAVIVHELGHFLVLRGEGLRLRRISLGVFGLEMDYWGELCGVGGAAAIAAGPLFGIFYAALCLFLPFEFCRLSGEVSLFLSLFNLLPVMPLDGGRLLELYVGERAIMISRVISLGLAAVGLFLWIYRGWFSLFAMGTWLAWANLNNKTDWE